MADQPFFENAAGNRAVSLNLDALTGNQTITLLDETSGSLVLMDVGSGSPEGSVTASVGRWYLDTSTGFKWEKRSGTGNTGWQPTAAKGGSATHSVAGTYTADALSAQNLDITLDANITELGVSNLDLLQTLVVGVTVGTAGSAVSALAGTIEIASGSLSDIGTAAGDKGTITFRYDNAGSVVRAFITAG